MTQDALMASLPDEVRAVIEAPQRQQAEDLNTLAVAIAKLRDEAVQARKESGIEDTWQDCEEAYLGIDDENRHEFANARWAKPMTMDGPLTRQRTNTTGEVKATAFVKLTARYVDAGAAKVCEIALPIDGKAFSLKATPVPEMAGAVGNATPAEQITGQPMPGKDGKPVTVGELAKHAISEAEEKAEKAGTRIHDWMVEYKHPAEMRKVIFDMARLGVGIIKGPIPEVRKSVVVRRAEVPPEVAKHTDVAGAVAAISVEVVEKVKPAARWVDPWNFFPAPGCGEDIHNGGYAFEADPMLPEELRKLAKTDGDGAFDAAAIDKVIAEGPGKSNLNDTGAEKQKHHRKQFMVWHFYGAIPREAFKAANERQAEALPEDGKDDVFAIVTLVNDTVIRCIQQPLDSGRLPYHVAAWRRRAGHWAGVGVAEQVRTPQRIVNAGTRALLNNAGKSAGSQIVMDPSAVDPANGDLSITPDKLWWIRQGVSVEDVRKVFAAFEWPNRTPEIQRVIEYGFKLAEEHSSIPLITQGQSGDTTPETFGGQQLQDNNANQLLRDVGFGLNDSITTPLVDQFYEWLLLDPDVPDSEKGDYQVDTSGALALIEKKLNDLFLPQLLQLSQNPVYELNPARVAEELMRSKRLSPTLFRYTEEELEKLRSAPPPAAPAVQAAQIRADAAIKVAQSRDQLQAQKNQNDLDRDTAYNQSLTERAQSDYAARMAELQVRERLAMLDYANRNQITIDTLKAKLADTTLKLQVQRELAGADGKGPQVATPPDEPPGRAPNGMAYQA